LTLYSLDIESHENLKEIIVVYFKTSARNLPGSTEENLEELQPGISAFESAVALT
jgi:hypothetical protein